MFKLFLFSTLICGLYSIEFDHPCRSDVPAKENFLAIVYEGIWYINQRSDVAGPECLTHRYTRIVNKTLSFNHLEEGVLDGAPFRETGIAVIAHPDVTPIRAIFNATVDQNEGSPIEFQYQVIATGKIKIFFAINFIFILFLKRLFKLCNNMDVH